MPASSNVVEFTITFGSTERGSCGKTCRRACWLNLEAHPAQDESEVSFRTCSRDIDVTPSLPLRIADCGLRIIRRVHCLCPVPAARSFNRSYRYREQFIGFGKKTFYLST